MDYNASRENLLVTHMSALRSLSQTWDKRASGLLIPLLSLPADAAASSLSMVLPKALLPFQMSSAQIGARFYDMRRTQSMDALPRTAARPPEFSRTVSDIDIEKLTASTAHKVGFLQSSLQRAIEEDRPEVFLNDAKRTTSLMVTQPNRETINDFILEDEYAASKVRVAAPDGCVFCQSMTGFLPMDDDDVEFHSFCNCVLDASFSDEINFRQSFADKVEEEREAALELIRSGEAGIVPLKPGSEEWTKSLKAELATSARTWRKEFEQRQNLNPEQKKFHREGTAKNVEHIAKKAGLVAQGKASWTGKELMLMKSYKMSPTQLSEPRTRPLGNNNKDVLKAMEIVRGTRNIKLPE